MRISISSSRSVAARRLHPQQQRRRQQQPLASAVQTLAPAAAAAAVGWMLQQRRGARGGSSRWLRGSSTRLAVALRGLALPLLLVQERVACGRTSLLRARDDASNACAVARPQKRAALDCARGCAPCSNTPSLLRPRTRLHGRTRLLHHA
jgi:hypothetical protein